GFFSLLMLSLPSGLTLYIFTNNILSIAQQMYLRRKLHSPKASDQTVEVDKKKDDRQGGGGAAAGRAKLRVCAHGRHRGQIGQEESALRCGRGQGLPPQARRRVGHQRPGWR